MRKVFSLLLALLIVASLAVPAFASSGRVDLKNKSITVTPALNNETATDLFGNFKGIMPGDTRTQEIKIRNLAVNYDYVKVYLKAVPHSKDNKPLIDVSVEENFDFLSQLTLTVKNGSKVIYSASADGTYQLDEAGDLKKAVYLGKLTQSNALKTMKLDVELKVPIDMNNDYANRMGEVDWMFYFEGYNNSKDNPKTGDYIIMGAVTLMAISGAALLILLINKRRKNCK